MGEREFYRELRQGFPELLAELDDGISTGLLHLEMAELARFAQDAIAGRDRETISRCFAFAARALETGTPAIQNAVAVSFLEHTVMDADSAAARDAEAVLPPSLQNELGALREHWAELARRSESSRRRDEATEPKRGRRTRR